MRHLLVVCLLGLAAVAAAPAPAQEQQGQAAEEYGGLPPGEGRDVVYGVCTACHSARLVTQQGMSRVRWKKTLEWMQEEQGMAELPPETMEVILDYLVTHFPEDRGRAQPGMTPPPTGLRVQPLMPAQ